MWHSEIACDVHFRAPCSQGAGRIGGKISELLDPNPFAAAPMLCKEAIDSKIDALVVRCGEVYALTGHPLSGRDTVSVAIKYGKKSPTVVSRSPSNVDFANRAPINSDSRGRAVDTTALLDP